MTEILMVKLGELVLKGLNRRKFEENLFKTIKYRLAGIGKFGYRYAQSTFYVEPQGGNDDSLYEDEIDAADKALSDIFGIASITRAALCEKNLDEITAAAFSYAERALLGAKTFKVDSKRSDKAFPLKSPELCAEMGGRILEKYPHLSVDVRNPDVTLWVEIREKGAYIHTGSRPGAGGLPVGTSGKAMLLLSGGIDSPVAGVMMAKRGAEISAVHFHSYPYTSERAKQKVLELAALAARFAGKIKVFVVSFTEIQEQMRGKIPEELFTITMRRIMMMIAEKIAAQTGALCLVTGESLAQVASQTMQGLVCSDAAVSIPVLRPLIGLDKGEIVARARTYGTFDKSIEPYEDCCAVFSPKHPDTKPKIEFVLKAEEKLPLSELIEKAVAEKEEYSAAFDRKTGIIIKSGGDAKLTMDN